MVTVMCPGTLGGMGMCPWLEAGAGAIRRLGIGDLRTALKRKKQTHFSTFGPDWWCTRKKVV